MPTLTGRVMIASGVFHPTQVTASGENVKRKRRTGKHFKKNRARTPQQEQTKINQSRDKASMDKLGALIVMAVAFAAAVIYFWPHI